MEAEPTHACTLLNAHLPAWDTRLIMEVFIEQQLPDNCVTLKVSPEGTGGEVRGWRAAGAVA